MIISRHQLFSFGRNAELDAQSESSFSFFWKLKRHQRIITDNSHLEKWQ